MALGKPYFLQAGEGDEPLEYDGREMRMPLDALVEQPGVCGSGQLLVTPRAAGANASVDVAGGYAIIARDGAFQGKLVVPNYAAINFTGVAAPPVSGTRNDLVALRANDKQGGSTTYDPELIYVSGNLARPASSIRLAQIVRRAGQTSVLPADIIDLRDAVGGLPGAGPFVEFFGGNGQPIPVRNFVVPYHPSNYRYATGFVIPSPTVASVDCTRPGLYGINASMTLNLNNPGARYLVVIRNNTKTGPGLSSRFIQRGAVSYGGQTGGTTAIALDAKIPCKVGDRLDVFIVQDASASTNVNDVAGDSAHCIFEYLKPLPGLL